MNPYEAYRELRELRNFIANGHVEFHEAGEDNRTVQALDVAIRKLGRTRLSEFASEIRVVGCEEPGTAAVEAEEDRR